MKEHQQSNNISYLTEIRTIFTGEKVGGLSIELLQTIKELRYLQLYMHEGLFPYEEEVLESKVIMATLDIGKHPIVCLEFKFLFGRLALTRVITKSKRLNINSENDSRLILFIAQFMQKNNISLITDSLMPAAEWEKIQRDPQ
ncbi:hypothetical protein [Psychrobacillus sp. FSL H8-0510]